MVGRTAFFELCGYLSVADVAAWAAGMFPPQWLTVLAYHRVCEPDPSSPWDRDVISATPEEFRGQLQFIRTHFTTISSAQVVLWKHGRLRMPRNPVVLTFDDGYRDNHDVVMPILREMGMVADFFICPWHIENRALFWWDKIAYCVRRSTKKAMTVTYPKRVHLDLSTPLAVEQARRKALGIVKGKAQIDISRYIRELQEAAGVEIREEADAEKLIMGWGDVRSLRKAGMGIGSHSYTHPLLAFAHEATVREELVRSKSAIEAALGERISTLAYPVGAASKHTRRMAEDAGYDIAYGYAGGVTYLHSPDFFAIRRIPVERCMSLAHFHSIVAMPYLSPRLDRRPRRRRTSLTV